MRPDGALDTSLEDESRQISKRAHSATKSKPAAKAKHHRAARYYGHRRFAFRFFFRGYRRHETNVSFWHFSDIQPALTNVRYWGESGHGSDLSVCPLMTQSGHFQQLRS